MGYNIEVSFDIHHNNITEVKNTITSLALDYNCDHYYYYYDMNNEIKHSRNHCIIVINFLDEDIFSCSKFIKIIRKLAHVYLECIYEDSQLCKLIYASQCYLKSIDKDKVVIYNKFKRERSHSENEKTILNEIKPRSRSGSITGSSGFTGFTGFTGSSGS